MIKYLCDRCHAQIEPVSRGIIFKHKNKFYDLNYYHRTSSDPKKLYYVQHALMNSMNG